MVLVSSKTVADEAGFRQSENNESHCLFFFIRVFYPISQTRSKLNVEALGFSLPTLWLNPTLVANHVFVLGVVVASINGLKIHCISENFFNGGLNNGINNYFAFFCEENVEVNHTP